MKLREGYSLAKCCRAKTGDHISGYYSHNQVMIVHKSNCPNLDKVDSERIVKLDWQQIIAEEDFRPESDYRELDELDWRILHHHRELGVDYSHVVARTLHVPRADVFARHHKLREMKLLARVKPLIMQYRKGIVDNKWIKHRNHTYYELTRKGRNYIAYYERTGRK
jgi:hypothetical protein